MYYRGANAAVVVYDVTNPESLQAAQSWVKEVRSRGSPGCIIAFTGNKADLESQRQVSRAEAEAWAAENGCLHMEASAKTGAGVVELFQTIAEKLPEEKEEESNRSFPILPDPDPAPKSSSCC